MKFRPLPLLSAVRLASRAHRESIATDLQSNDVLVVDLHDDRGHESDPADIIASKVADIEPVERNPVLEIGATRAIHAIVLKGDLDRGALDAMLAALRARVAARETGAN